MGGLHTSWYGEKDVEDIFGIFTYYFEPKGHDIMFRFNVSKVYQAHWIEKPFLEIWTKFHLSPN